jgi:hypothetical protein
MWVLSLKETGGGVDGRRKVLIMLRGSGWIEQADDGHPPKKQEEEGAFV